MTPGEALVARIFDYVKTVEPPHLVEPVDQGDCSGGRHLDERTGVHR